MNSKQDCALLVVTPSSIPQNPSFKSFQQCRDLERTNVLDLKALLVKRVGMQRANRYFVHFMRFLGSPLSKVEFDKLVIATIGKKNLALHNQLVRAILSNAVKGKAPPPLLPSSYEDFEKFSSKYQSPSVTSYRPHTSPSTVSNGDSFLSSPRSVKSTARQYRDRDYRVSPLAHTEAHSAPNDLSQPVQPEAAVKQFDAESSRSREPHSKRARIDCSASDDSAGVIESEVLGGGEVFFHKQKEEVPLLGISVSGFIGSSSFTSKSSAKRPSFCAFPAHSLTQDGIENNLLSSDDLPSGDLMHSLVEQAAIREGLEGVSRESAEILNLGLDAYLKRLIKSCVSARTGSGFPSQDKIMNGGAVKREQGMKEQSISLMDFKAAINRNPQQLGTEWAVQLEKVLFRVVDQ